MLGCACERCGGSCWEGRRELPTVRRVVGAGGRRRPAPQKGCRAFEPPERVRQLSPRRRGTARKSGSVARIASIPRGGTTPGRRARRDARGIADGRASSAWRRWVTPQWLAPRWAVAGLAMALAVTIAFWNSRSANQDQQEKIVASKPSLLSAPSELRKEPEQPILSPDEERDEEKNVSVEQPAAPPAPPPRHDEADEQPLQVRRADDHRTSNHRCLAARRGQRRSRRKAGHDPASGIKRPRYHHLLAREQNGE